MSQNLPATLPYLSSVDHKVPFSELPEGGAQPAAFSIAENSPPPATINGKPILDHLDHFVLTVSDIDASVEFYTRVLGMEKRVSGDVENGKGRVAVVFGNHKINLQHERAEIAPHAAQPTKGSADICVITKHSISAIVAHLEELDRLHASSDLSSADHKVAMWTSPYFRTNHFSAQRLSEPQILQRCERSGAQGKIESIYLRDPDGNLIEVSNYERGL